MTKKQAIKAELAHLRDAFSGATPDVAPALAAYNAYLRWPTRLDDTAAGPPVFAPWQSELPPSQARLWRSVAQAAASVGAEPDTYVWTLCRAGTYVRAADLPDMRQAYQDRRQNLADNAVQGILRLSVLFDRVKDLAHGYAVASLKPDQALTALDTKAWDAAYAQALRSGRRCKRWATLGSTPTASLSDLLTQRGRDVSGRPMFRVDWSTPRDLDIVFSWSVARVGGLRTVADRLQAVAAMTLWLDRDRYQHVAWGKFAISEDMMRLARSTYTATMH